VSRRASRRAGLRAGDDDVDPVVVEHDREPVAIVEARVRQFRSFLLARPERCIAVVGHGTFFFHLTGKVLANCEVEELELAP
jgi:broad specificity phosphatase PhoE